MDKLNLNHNDFKSARRTRIYTIHNLKCDQRRFVLTLLKHQRINVIRSNTSIRSVLQVCILVLYADRFHKIFLEEIETHRIQIMKLTIATLFAVVSVVDAFTTNARSSRASIAISMSSEEGTPMEETPVVIEPPKPKLPEMSESLPFMMRPPALDGSMVGDVGFDPLGFAKTKEDLMNYREAEIKHCRLAMLVSF